MRKQIVVTGLGVVSPIGIGRDAFWAALEEGRSGIKPVTLFDTTDTQCKLAGEVSDFKPEEYLGRKGLRNLDRSTKLINVAAKLALDDANFQITDENAAEVGIAIGSTFGSVHSISEFDKQSIREGPRYVNPALFPNTVINSPASQVSIRFGAQAFNTTITTGFVSSIDAVGYALEFFDLDRAEVILIGGVEEMCIQTFLGIYKLGFLVGSKNNKREVSAPFDRRHNGIIFGEGAAMLVCEEKNAALKRGAKIFAEIKGYGSAFDPYRMNKYSPRAEGATESIIQTLINTSLKPQDINVVVCSANANKYSDRMETTAIKNAFLRYAKDIPVTTIKSIIGETYSAAGIMNVAAAVGMVNRGFIPPVLNLVKKAVDCDLNYAMGKTIKTELDNVLTTAFGPSGNNSCVVISRV